MQFRIKNQTPQLLILPLNSGKTVHLTPGETSRPIEHMELNGNTKLEKLSANNSITMMQESAKPASSRGETAGDKEPKRSTKSK